VPAGFRVPEEPVNPLALTISEGNTGALVADRNGSPRREDASRTEASGGRPHGSDSPAGAGAEDPRLETLMQENAQLQQKVKDITRKAIFGGVAAAGVGLAAGMFIESETSDKPVPPAENT
jgi:hypothetical protein